MWGGSCISVSLNMTESWRLPITMCTFVLRLWVLSSCLSRHNVSEDRRRFQVGLCVCIVWLVALLSLGSCGCVCDRMCSRCETGQSSHAH